MDINDFIEQVYDPEENIIKSWSEIECLCSTCKEMRRMHLQLWKYIHPHDNQFTRMGINQNNIIKDSATKEQVIDSIFPSLWIAKCMQCKKDHLILIYKLNDTEKILILSESLQGVATIHTPDAVKYYLDQAYKSKMIGANSACVAMYRAVLDQILFSQGYTVGMLGQKLLNLTNDIKNGKGKEWTKTIDKELFTFINKLGNGSIHPNDGDISKQSILDDNLIKSIDIIFKELLEEIYEKPLEKESRKAALKNAAKTFDNYNKKNK